MSIYSSIFPAKTLLLAYTYLHDVPVNELYSSISTSSIMSTSISPLIPHSPRLVLLLNFFFLWSAPTGRTDKYAIKIEKDSIIANAPGYQSIESITNSIPQSWWAQLRCEQLQSFGARPNQRWTWKYTKTYYKRVWVNLYIDGGYLPMFQHHFSQLCSIHDRALRISTLELNNHEISKFPSTCYQ